MSVFQFGKFDGVCEVVSLPLCPLIGQPSPGTNRIDGVEATCYSRNVELANTLIFQPATLIIHFISLIMTSIMIYHIKSKYTAVGRKEIVMFFYLYMVTSFLEMLLVSGIIPTASNVYPYFTAVHIGLITTTFWLLMLNGFVGFQFAEDGTPASLWSLRLTSLFIFCVTTFIAIATFNRIGPFNPTTPTILWLIFFPLNALLVLIYVVSQVVLVVNTLDDRWPLGDISFGVVFFVIGQVTLFAFSVRICDVAKHYIDGFFFGTICNLLAVMMVYKYWDSITKEDLEFSVGSKQNVWEIKELLGDEGHTSSPYSQQYYY
ncbi:uncharacterized protein VTP21DRAFT_6036 [Calcarisporiella thermophila]|uniref:uncharacterized protein n=1 Tax=Calcarisporiella thermophila TaxID=911321 RepID=UPI0037442184